MEHRRAAVLPTATIPFQAKGRQEFRSFLSKTYFPEKVTPETDWDGSGVLRCVKAPLTHGRPCSHFKCVGKAHQTDKWLEHVL